MQTIYKGYVIKTITTDKTTESHIFLNAQFVGGTYAMNDKINSEEKAKIKIDCWLNGTDYKKVILSKI